MSICNAITVGDAPSLPDDTCWRLPAGGPAGTCAAEKFRYAKGVIAAVDQAVVVTDPGGRILHVNRAFTAMSGYAEAELLGRTMRLLQSGRHDSAFYAAMWQELSMQGHWHGEIWNRRANGTIGPELLTINPLYDAFCNVTHFVGTYRDLVPVKRDEALIHQLATRDQLTGLAKGDEFQRHLDAVLHSASPQRTLLLVGLDRLQGIVESLGHAAGDFILQAVAERLVRAAGPQCLVARWLGDQFCILAETAAAETALTLAAALLRAVAEPVHLFGQDYMLTACVGICFAPAHGDTAENLLKHAELALHSAKRAGRNLCRTYADNMGADAVRRLALESELREAIARNELLLHYQPQVDLASRDIVGVEALVRWAHPRRGPLAPAQFIPLAEETGLILALGDWVLAAACRQMALWREAGYTDLTLAVNFSPHQFDQPDWLGRVLAVLADTGLPPRNLELEITESALMHDPERARGMLEQARASGIRIAVDDFGTGYSSLAYLKTLPVDRLKIDQSFVRGCAHDPSDVAIIETILGLTDRLGMAVIAEGVETPEQLDFLHERHCPQTQGYLFSAPLAAESLGILLRNATRFGPPAINAQSLVH